MIENENEKENVLSDLRRRRKQLGELLGLYDNETQISKSELSSFLESEFENEIRPIIDKMKESDESFAEWFEGAIYASMDKIKNESENQIDYEIDSEQWAKFVGITTYLHSISTEYDTVYPAKIENENGYIVAAFTSIELLSDESKNQFAKMILYCDYVNIHATTDGDVIFEIVIPNIYVPKT